jgi:hypothetical protein
VGDRLLGFEITGWDYITFATLAFVAFGLVAALVWLAGLPGRIALSRKHPDAEAVNVMGWAGFLAVVPWIQAFIWAFKPTDIIDIRRWPAEEREFVEEMVARMKGEAPPDRSAPDASASPDEPAPSQDGQKG